MIDPKELSEEFMIRMASAIQEGKIQSLEEFFSNNPGMKENHTRKDLEDEMWKDLNKYAKPAPKE